LCAQLQSIYSTTSLSSSQHIPFNKRRRFNTIIAIA
jgi:hypothetical protein